MAYSNRVSLDTDVIFLRTVFAFSTNNVPVSTNYIMAAGCNGQIMASDALRTLETYGIGYLPSTFSTFDGQIISVSLSVLSTGVTNTMLYSTQNFLLENICSVQSNVEILSSYVLENVIPSSFSTVNQQIIELNSSFQGYIVSQAVTPVQLFSTANGLIDYTNASTSNLSTSVDAQFHTYSNYVDANYTPISTFSNFSTSVSTTFSDIYNSISTTNSNFVALSNYTRIAIGSISTDVNTLSNQVTGLSNTFNTISSTSQNPFFVIGVQSTMQNVFFGSNIQVSSITSNIYLRGGNVGIANTNPTSRLDVSGGAIIRGDLAVNSNIQVSSITSNIYLRSGNVGIGTNNPATKLDVSGGAIIRGEFSVNSNIQVSSITSNIYLQSGNVGIGTNNPTTKLDVSGSATISGNLAVDTNTLYVDAGNNRVGIVNGAPSYPLDVVGDINFTGTLRQNGVPYGGGGGTTNVLGTLSVANQVYFGSNITASTINVGSATLFARNCNVGINCNAPLSFLALDVNGPIQINGGMEMKYNGSFMGGETGGLTIYHQNNIDPLFNVTVLGGISNVNINKLGDQLVYSLDVSGAAAVSGDFDAGVGILHVDATNSYVGIANPTPAYTFDVSGDINFTGTLYQNGTPFSGGGGTTNVLGTLSTTNQVYFGSNITASTINVGSGTLFVSNSNVDISGTLHVTSTIHTLDLNVSSIIDMPYHTLYAVDPLGTVGINTNAPGYALDVVGDINFTGTLRQNGNPYSGGGGGGSANVLGTLSVANQVYFGSNITLSTMNLGSRTFFASNGVVGIGTSTPTTTLDVSGGAIIRGDFAVNSNIQVSSITSNIYLRNGNVGVGTNNPTTKLDVSGGGIIRGDFAVNSNIQVSSITSNIYLQNGNVGVGTTNPTNKFDVSGGAIIRGDFAVNSNIQVSSITSNIYLQNGNVGVGTANPTSKLDVSGGAIIRGDFAVNSNIQVSSITSNIYLQSGNVGIGTNNPTTKLDVSGGANITGNLAVDTNTLYVDAGNNRVGIVNATPSYPLDVTGDINFTGTLRQNGTPYGGGGTTNVLGTLSAANQVYFGSNITASTINVGSDTFFASNGFVGIGTTTPATALDVSGRGIIRGDFAVNSNIQVSSITSNIYLRNGNVGIKTNNPVFALDVSGSLQVAGRIFSKAGTAADPVFANIDDFNQDTGLFYPGAGQLSITNDGAEGYRFTGTALYALCNAFEAVGNGSNKSIVIDPVDTSGGNPYVLVRTSIDDTAYGVPSIELQTPSLTIKQFAVPTTGAGFAQNNAYNVYTYPTAGGVNLAYVIDASGRMGIGGGTAANTALNVTGVVNITSNLAVDTNVLYADAVNNRVGISCNTPSYVLDVNGNTNLNGRIFSQNGNASAPAFGSVNDQDTGLYFPSDGQISFATNSAERGRINGNGLAMLCNAIESVGYNSNRGVILDGGGTSAVGDTTLTLRTNSSNANTDGKPYITMQVSSLMMRQFLNPAAGTGLLKNRALNTYVYNTGGGDTYLSYIIDASGQFGIAGDTTADTALTVNGAANITSNLIVDTNTLYVNAGTNRVGVGCNSPSFTLDVNGALNVASNLSTTMLNVSTVNTLISTPKQSGVLITGIGTAATVDNITTNVELLTYPTDVFPKYNMINLSFNVAIRTNQGTSTGQNWAVLRIETDSITTNSMKFTLYPGSDTTVVNSFNYIMILNRDFKRSDTYIKFIIESSLTGGGGFSVSQLMYINVTGIY